MSNTDLSITVAPLPAPVTAKIDQRAPRIRLAAMILAGLLAAFYFALGIIFFIKKNPLGAGLAYGNFAIHAFTVVALFINMKGLVLASAILELLLLLALITVFLLGAMISGIAAFFGFVGFIAELPILLSTVVLLFVYHRRQFRAAKLTNA